MRRDRHTEICTVLHVQDFKLSERRSRDEDEAVSQTALVTVMFDCTISDIRKDRGVPASQIGKRK
jgi:hypothetical protein